MERGGLGHEVGGVIACRRGSGEGGYGGRRQRRRRSSNIIALRTNSVSELGGSIGDALRT